MTDKQLEIAKIIYSLQHSGIKTAEEVLRIASCSREDRLEGYYPDEDDFQMRLQDYADDGDWNGIFNKIIYPAMKEYAEQYLRLAAREAKSYASTSPGFHMFSMVDKNSILKIISQLK